MDMIRIARAETDTRRQSARDTTIVARRTDGGMHMTIRDNGVGVAAAAPNPAGFGRNLVEMVVRQMRGTIAWADAGPGTTVEIDIPLKQLA